MIRSLSFALVLFLVIGCARRYTVYRGERRDALLKKIEGSLFPVPKIYARGKMYWSSGEANFFGEFTLERRDSDWMIDFRGPLGISPFSIIVKKDSVYIEKGEEERVTSLKDLRALLPFFSLFEKESFGNPKKVQVSTQGNEKRVSFAQGGTEVVVYFEEDEITKISFKEGSSSLILSNFEKIDGKAFPKSILFDNRAETLEVEIKNIKTLKPRKGEG